MNVHRVFGEENRVRRTRHFKRTLLDQIHPARRLPIGGAQFEPEGLGVSIGKVHGRIPPNVLNHSRFDPPAHGTRGRARRHFPGLPPVRRDLQIHRDRMTVWVLDLVGNIDPPSTRNLLRLKGQNRGLRRGQWRQDPEHA